MIGKIKNLKRDFGFIINPDTRVQYFFHQEDLQDCEFRELVEDRTMVEFEPTQGKKGPRAAMVRLIQ